MKKIHVRLSEHWRTAPDAAGPDAASLHWRGGAFFAGALLTRAGQVAACLPSAQAGPTSWARRLHELNGFFALVLETPDRVIAAVDRVRSHPLFYGESRAGICLSDDAEWVRQQVGDCRMDPVARDEFQLTGYVTGRETLYPHVRQLQAGELLQIDLNPGGSGFCLSARRYFRFVHAEPERWDEHVLRQGLEAAAHGAIDRLMRYANGRQIVLPLSGGYDSRLIATLLRRAGYDKIRTFISLRWRHGALGTVNVTMLTYPRNLEGSITILGERGTVRIGGIALNEVRHWEFAEPVEEDADIASASYPTANVYGHGHAHYYDNVIRVLRGEACPETDGREGLKTLQLLVAAYRSARDGQRIALPLEM